MKQARVAWNGTVTEAEPLDSGRLLLPDGTIVDEHEVMWLPRSSRARSWRLG